MRQKIVFRGHRRSSFHRCPIFSPSGFDFSIFVPFSRLSPHPRLRLSSIACFIQSFLSLPLVRLRSVVAGGSSRVRNGRTFGFLGRRESKSEKGGKFRSVRPFLALSFFSSFLRSPLPPPPLSLSLCLSFFFSPSLNWSKFSDETTYSSRSNLFYSTSPRVTMPLENPLSFGSLDVGSLSLFLSATDAGRNAISSRPFPFRFNRSIGLCLGESKPVIKSLKIFLSAGNFVALHEGEKIEASAKNFAIRRGR